MNQNSHESESAAMERHLRSYLISRFLIIIVICYLVSRFFDGLVRLITPFLEQKLYLNELIPESDGLHAGLFILRFFLWKIVPDSLPTILAVPVKTLILRTPDMAVAFQTPAQVSALGHTAVYIYYIVLFVCAMAILFLSLLPYLAAAFYYSYIVFREVRKLRAYDEQKRLKYEQERNLMLADLAHDIKTPITTVVGYSKALRDGLIPPEQEHKYLDVIGAKSLRISDLVNMLFDFVKMDSAGFALELKAIDFGQLILSCCAECYTDFEDKNITLEIDVPEVPMPCQADAGQLSRVIHNLLSNALKYLNAGDHVLVRITLPASGRDAFYRLTVADTGAAIEPELAAHIFEPFSRGDKARSSRGGSGLGLSIAHKIILLHGGTLRLDTQTDVPWTKAFLVSFPAAAVPGRSSINS